MARTAAGSQVRRRPGPTVIVWLCLAVLAGACTGPSDDSQPATSTTEAPATTVSSSANTTPSSTTTTAAVPWPTVSWPVSTPEDQGIDSDVLADLVERMAAQGGFDSLTVVRNGYLVLDTTFYPFPEDTGHAMASVTKSVTSTLLGIAIDRGLLSGVDVPVLDVMADAAPQSIGDLKAEMTVEHLLTMSTGLECRDSFAYDYEGTPALLASDDWVAHVLALPMQEPAGTRFEYCNGASHVLSSIISEVTDRPAADFAEDVLFGPLGINDVVWPASDGITVGFGELMLRPSDAAKLGYLILREGRWDGDEVVSAAWVEAATESHIAVPSTGLNYGYQWWIGGAGDWVTARGSGGQFIFVVRPLDLVVVMTGGLTNYESGTLPGALMQRYVLPATRPDPLPPDPDARARLRSVVTAAQNGPEPSPVSLPALAQTLSGVRFDGTGGDPRLEWFTLTFGSDSARLAIDFNVYQDDVAPHIAELRGFEDFEEPIECDVGLDGRFTATVLYGQPAVCRGEWISDDTFVVESHILGHGAEGRLTFEFAFDDGTATVRLGGGDGSSVEAVAERLD